MAVQQNLTIFRGQALVVTAAPQGPAVDVTGWSVQFTARREYGSPVAAVLLSTANGKVAVADAAAGVFGLTFSRADTLLDPWSYPYSLERTDAGAEDCLAYGNLIVLATER